MLCGFEHVYVSLNQTRNASTFHFIHHVSEIRTCLSSVSLQQLRANIREMEKLCARVRAEDAAALEELVKPVKDRASAAAQDFLLLHSNPVSQPTPPAAQPSSCVSSSCPADDDEEPVYGRQLQLRLPEIPDDQSAAESWDNLEEV